MHFILHIFLPHRNTEAQPKNRIFKYFNHVNTLRTGDADLRFYITTVQDG